MIEFELLSTFVVASVLITLAPGPDNLYVLTQSAHHGRRAGMGILLGLCTGLMIHTAAVALGIATLVQNSPAALTLLKIAGAGYLLYLAWQAWQVSATGFSHQPPSALRFGRLYRRGLIMNLSNPKVSLFFLAFLPQFIQPDLAPIGQQVLVLGLMVIFITFAVFGSIAWSAGHLKPFLTHSPKAQTLLQRITALVFIGLALQLAFGEL
jgi:threonine/homoserine/homoserine lactone efflux protein